MRNVKLCYRELQGLKAHFRKIKNKNGLAVEVAPQNPEILQNLLRQPKEIFPQAGIPKRMPISASRILSRVAANDQKIF